MGCEVSKGHVSGYGNVLLVLSIDLWYRQLQSNRTSNKLMVIDFSAAWRGPCTFIEPVTDDLAKEFQNVHFNKIDVNWMPGVAKDFGVVSMPTFILMKGGNELGRVVGVKKDELRRMIEKHKS